MNIALILIVVVATSFTSALTFQVLSVLSQIKCESTADRQRLLRDQQNRILIIFFYLQMLCGAILTSSAIGLGNQSFVWDGILVLLGAVLYGGYMTICMEHTMKYNKSAKTGSDVTEQDKKEVKLVP